MCQDFTEEEQMQKESFEELGEGTLASATGGGAIPVLTDEQWAAALEGITYESLGLMPPDAYQKANEAAAAAVAAGNWEYKFRYFP
jgi:hypothetical protein